MSSLAGKRILVTRARLQAGQLTHCLLERGAEPVGVPVLQIAPPASFQPLDEALLDLDRFDWLILTSGNSIEAIGSRAAHLGIELADAVKLQVAAIGTATAEAARLAGLRVSVVAEVQVAEGLLAALGGAIHGERILFPRASAGRDLIPAALRAAGAKVDLVEAYRNLLPAEAPELLRAAVAAKIDAALFTSSSSATHLAQAAHQAGIVFPLAGVPAISIGPITSQTLRELDWKPVAEAHPHSLTGLLAAVEAFFAGS